MLAQLVTFAWDAPSVDFHALAPEIIVAATLVLLVIVDAFTGEDKRWAASSIAGVGLLLALVPVATLAEVTAAIDVLDNVVKLRVLLPGMLGMFSGLIQSTLQKKGSVLLEDHSKG